jgi:hypothetical protein
MSNEATPPANAHKAIPAWIFKPTFTAPGNVVNAVVAYKAGEATRDAILSGVKRTKTNNVRKESQEAYRKACEGFQNVKREHSRVIRSWMNHVSSKHHDVVTNLCLEHFLKLAEEMGKDNDLLDAISRSLPPTVEVINGVDGGRAMDCTLPIPVEINGLNLFLRVDCEDGRVNGFKVADEKSQLNSLFGGLASVAFAYQPYAVQNEGRPRTVEAKVNGNRDLAPADMRVVADVLVQLADLADVLAEFEKGCNADAYGELLEQAFEDSIGVANCHMIHMPSETFYS